MHPIQESCRRPTAALDRNLAYLGLVEIFCGYPFDGVVLMTGCDKTTPACLMAAATVNLPAIVLSGGPMIDSYYNGKLAGSGMALWEARRQLAAGKIDGRELIDMTCASTAQRGPLQHHGHRAFHELAGRSSGHVAARLRRDPRALRRARQDGVRDRPAHRRHGPRRPHAGPHPDAARPSRTPSWSTPPSAAPPTARPTSPPSPATWAWTLTVNDWETVGHDIPLLVNVQPAGDYLGEGSTAPAAFAPSVGELIRAGKIHSDALTVTGTTIGENCGESRSRRSRTSSALTTCR